MGMKKFLLVLFSFGTIGLSCLAGFAGGYFGLRFANRNNLNDIVSGVTQDVRVTNEESAVIDVANKSSAAVVSIVISKDVPVYENYYYNPLDGFNFQVPGRRQTGTEEQQIGAGTGFIISKEGMIVTNRHVVEDETASYTVIFNDGTKKEATVLARDTLFDIAFLKIDAVDITPLNFGSSENLKVGQTVIAIGNALGEFSNTVSTGIISGLSRDIVAGDSNGRNQEQLDDVIQTDASINVGNSGGPLLDINGNVIGVNVAVADAENIGFAIPADVVRDLLERLTSEGKIERPVLGVRYIPVTESLQEQNNLTVDYGALVSRGDTQNDLAVIPGSAADKAGIVENDIILEVAGVKLDSSTTLQNQIQKFKVGDEVTLKILRKGSEIEIKVILQKAS
jgi:serine protease Do